MGVKQEARFAPLKHLGGPENCNWDSSTLTWSNAPSFDSVVQDYQLVNGAANSLI